MRDQDILCWRLWASRVEDGDGGYIWTICLRTEAKSIRIPKFVSRSRRGRHCYYGTELTCKYWLSTRHLDSHHRARAGMRLQMITSNNYSESKKLGIDTGWKTTISGDSDTEQTLTPARGSCLLRMENVEEEAGSEVLGHVLGAREAAGCWREVWWKHPC